MVLKCEALAGVVEEMGATRAELSTASARVAHLRGKVARARGSGAASGSGAPAPPPRATAVPAHTLWSAMEELSSATPAQLRAAAAAAAAAASAGAGAGAGAAGTPSAARRPASRSPSPLPDSPRAALGATHPATASPPLPAGGKFGSEPTGRIEPPRKEPPRPFSPLPPVEMANSRGRSMLRSFAGRGSAASGSGSGAGAAGSAGAGAGAGAALPGSSTPSSSSASAAEAAARGAAQLGRPPSPVRAKAEAQWAAFVRQFEGAAAGAQ